MDKEMQCEHAIRILDDYLDGWLDTQRQRAYESHIETCEPCRRQTEAAIALQRTLAALPTQLPEEGFADRVVAQAAASRRGAHRAPKVAVAGFLAAVAAGAIVFINSDSLVRAPGSDAAALPTVTMTLDMPRVVKLVFASNEALEDVALWVELPEGVELNGYAGLSRVRWNTRLQPGKNVLPLELVALGGMGGELTARLQHGDQERVFKVFVSVAAG